MAVLNEGKKSKFNEKFPTIRVSGEDIKSLRGALVPWWASMKLQLPNPIDVDAIKFFLLQIFIKLRVTA